jgi:hypothetical protein
MDDKRTGGRTKSFLRGQIVFNNRMSTMDCLVRDISANGAKLMLAQGLALPDVFELVIPQKGETLRARLSWRRGEEIGVAFSRKPHDLAVRVRELEAENARLRALLGSAQAGAPAAPVG